VRSVQSRACAKGEGCYSEDYVFLLFTAAGKVGDSGSLLLIRIGSGKKEVIMSEYRSQGLGEEDVRRIIRDETMGRAEAPPQTAPIADPTPVGLAGFALTTFLCMTAVVRAR
jgi:hypothetical protein